MKFKQLLSALGFTLVSTLLLTACSAKEEDLHHARYNMSCGELAMKIGRLQEAKSQSETDIAFDGIEGAASGSTGGAVAAGIGGMFDGISQGVSAKRLEQYQSIYRQRGCR